MRGVQFNETHDDGTLQRCRHTSARHCRMTNDRSLLQQSHAVIFHIPDLDVHNMPHYRSPEQRWIFFHLESPRNTFNGDQLKTLRENNQFDWTMTYRYALFLNKGPR